MDINAEEAAYILNCSPATFVRMRMEGRITPTQVSESGKKTYRLYDKDDVLALKKELDAEDKKKNELVMAIGKKYYGNKLATYSGLAKEHELTTNQAAHIIRKYNEIIRGRSGKNE